MTAFQDLHCNSTLLLNISIHVNLLFYLAASRQTWTRRERLGNSSQDRGSIMARFTA